MDKGILKAIWAGMFILCAVLGFLPEPEGFNKYLLVVLSLLFFLPPALLLYTSWKAKDEKQLHLVKKLAILSLGLTLGLMVGNLLSVLAPTAVGNVLYWALVILGTPLISGQYWFIGPAGWALLLFTSMELLRGVKK